MPLVLSRKEGQTLRIGKDIVIHFRGNVKVSVEAPRDVKVVRGELESK